MRLIDEYKSQNAGRHGERGRPAGAGLKAFSSADVVNGHVQVDALRARARPMGISGCSRDLRQRRAGAGAPVPFRGDAAVGDPLGAPRRLRVGRLEAARRRAPAGSGRQDVAWSRGLPTRPSSPARRLGRRDDCARRRQYADRDRLDAAPSPIAVDADGEPWTSWRATPTGRASSAARWTGTRPEALKRIPEGPPPHFTRSREPPESCEVTVHVIVEKMMRRCAQVTARRIFCPALITELVPTAARTDTSSCRSRSL